MNWKFEKEFREAHPETIGETDKEFDLDNYKDWLEHQLVNKNDLLQRVSQHSELLKEIFSITAGAWDDPVISEDLYNRMEAAISFNCG